MDRRESLKTILGKENRSKKDFFNSINIRSKPVAFGLDMYSGSWTSTEAAHLMRRCMYGPTMAQINQAVDEGMMTTLALLLADVPENDPPVNPNYADDPYVPIGSTWVNAPYSTDRQELGYRNQSFNSWLMQNILNEGVSIKEKMVVFWHNHFVTANVNDPKFDFNYFSTL